MKKLLCLLLAMALMLSLAACADGLFVITIAGTWSCRREETMENPLQLLENYELYEEEIALIDFPLYTVKHVQFNEDMTYRYFYDAQQEKACVREFFLAVFDALYEGRSTLSDCYEIDMSSLSKDDFLQRYADFYEAENFDALIDLFVDSAYDYDNFTDAESGTFTMSLNQINMDAPGEEFDGTVGFKVQDNTLTLTYADMTEVYNKVN